MTAHDYRPPKRPPTQRGHLERLVNEYSRSHGIAVARVRRRLSVITLIGALDRVREDVHLPESWRDPYRADATRLAADLPADVEVAASEVREFIAQIDRAR